MSAKGRTEAIQVLLRHGAQVDARSSNQYTPLMLASSWGGTEAMEILLQHRAQVQVLLVDKFGCTPLFYAIQQRCLGAVEVLLRHGARVDSKISDYDTVSLIVALRNWDTDAMEDWLRHSDRYYDQREHSTLMQWAIWKRDHHFLNLLFQNGAEVEARDHQGLTPLTWASQHNKSKDMEVLLRHGAQVDAKNPDGMTDSLGLGLPNGKSVDGEVFAGPRCRHGSPGPKWPEAPGPCSPVSVFGPW